jgi:hypothetical protein
MKIYVRICACLAHASSKYWSEKFRTETKYMLRLMHLYLKSDVFLDYWKERYAFIFERVYITVISRKLVVTIIIKPSCLPPKVIGFRVPCISIHLIKI